MKKVQVVLIIVLMSLSIEHYAQNCFFKPVTPGQTFYQCDDNTWVLVFEDNFDGNSLDLTKWNPCYGVPRDYDFETQKAWYLPENLEVSNGILKIITKKLIPPESHTWVTDYSTNPWTTKTPVFTYTTGELCTYQKFGYGKFEARIKIPKGKGLAPAFWTYSGNPWNEIDICEFEGESSPLAKINHMNVHDDYYDGTHRMCPTNYTGVDFSLDFHTFTLEWEKDHIAWYVDGVLKRIDYRYFTMLGQIAGCMIHGGNPYMINRIYPVNPMAIVLSFAIKNDYLSPDNTTPFPSQVEVDWVRYYKKCPCDNNVIITNPSQCALNNGEFNVLTGKNVEINCNFTIPQGKQLDIVAQNSISLKPGFCAEAGSTFSAKIDPSICNNASMAMNENFELEENMYENTSSVNNNKSFIKEDVLTILDVDKKTFGVRIYPNPNKGNFTVEFDDSIDYRKYTLKIVNMQEQVIYSVDNMNNSNTIIHLNKFSAGVYNLILYKKDTLERIFYKLVIIN